MQNLFHLYADEFVEVLAGLASSYRRPTVTFDAFVTRLGKSVPRFVALVRAYMAQHPG